MISVIYDRPGEPSQVLKVVNVETPEPGPKEVLVRMLEMPITPADLATIRGVYRSPQKTPTVPGYAGMGVVEKNGSQATTFPVGTHVLVLPFKTAGWGNGCWQQYLCTAETELLKIPEGPNLEYMPDFFNTPLTAWVMVVDMLNLSAGQTLLLTAAGSNVAKMIIQLSLLRGFSVIGVVRRPEQVAEIKKLGAKEVICSSTEDISKRVMTITNLKGVDAVIDSVGGDISSQCFKLLSDWGKMIVYGLLDKERNSSIDIRKMLFYNLKLSGFWLPGWWFNTDLKSRTTAVNKTLALVQNGTLLTPVEKKYKLEQIADAVVHSEKPGNFGRIMLV